MQSKLSHRSCITFFNHSYDYFGIRAFINMLSNSSFITIFVLLFVQIFAESKAASISRDSGVRWETGELQPVQNTAEQDTSPVDTSFKNMTKKLFMILDEMQDIIDLMPADDANVNSDRGYQQDSSGSSTAASSEFSDLRQKKQMALNSYLAIVWNITNAAHPNQPMPPLQEPPKVNSISQQLDNLKNKVEERQRIPDFSKRPRMLSVYPICNNYSSMDDNRVPTNSIDLLFDLNFSKPSHDVIVNVTSAFLRIYKRSVYKDSYSMQFPPNKNVTFIATYYKSPHHNTRKDPNKRGIKLGEQTFRIGEERWTEWDIKKAVSAWYNNTSRNNGVSIKVADDQIRLPAREFFNIPINCSYITEWPMLTPQVMRNTTYSGISTEIPFLDVTIEELPKVEVKFIEKEQELVREVNSIKQHVNAAHTMPNTSAEHKHRHHKKNNKETKESSEDYV